MKKAIYADLSRCIACRACEVACEQEYGTARVKVKTVTDETRAGAGVGVPVSCRQCATPFCALVCPEKALVGTDAGLEFDSGLCTGCGLCELACPFGAIELNSGFVLRCELCSGKDRPICVATCPAGALAYTDSESFGKKARQGKGKKMLEALFRPSGTGQEAKK